MSGIKNFIYLDEYKMYSISSQIFEGITEYLVDHKKEISQGSETQKGPILSGRILADMLVAETGKQEKKYLHDYSYKLFEERLNEQEKILSIDEKNIDEVISKIDNTSFVKIKGRAIFNDINIITKTLNNYNALGEAITYITNFKKLEEVQKQLEKASESMGDRNQKARLEQKARSVSNIKVLAKEQGLHQDPKLLEYLVKILEYGFQDQFNLQINILQHVFTANLKRDCLRESEQLLVNKYSRIAEKEFTLFGMVTQSNFLTQMKNEETNKNNDNDRKSIKEALIILIEGLAGVETAFIGRLTNEIIIDPIAVYREL